jgi:hypothetical protein
LELFINYDRLVLAIPRSFILISLLLSQLHSIYGLGFTAFVDINLLQSAFTGFCPLAKVLKLTGNQGGYAFKEILASLDRMN